MKLHSKTLQSIQGPERRHCNIVSVHGLWSRRWSQRRNGDCIPHARVIPQPRPFLNTSLTLTFPQPSTVYLPLFDLTATIDKSSQENRPPSLKESFIQNQSLYMIVRALLQILFGYSAIKTTFAASWKKESAIYLAIPMTPHARRPTNVGRSHINTRKQ